MSHLTYTDLAPSIPRQRLVVEGYPSQPITSAAIQDYLSQLSSLTQMRRLLDPVVTHRSDLYGWAGWIHWETSGAHFYAWEQPLLFFSVDIYTCKPFDPQAVVEFTRAYFSATAITARDFSSSPLLPTTDYLSSSGGVVKYTLTDTDLDSLTSRLLAEQPPRTSDALLLYRFEGSEIFANLGRHIERQVFQERFGNNEADMRRIYGDFESGSEFYVVVDQETKRPVGNMRFIRCTDSSGVSTLPTLRDAHTHLGITPSSFQTTHGIPCLTRVLDVGTLAIPAAQRSRDQHLIAAMLYRGPHLRARLDGKTHYVALVDGELWRTFGKLGFPFVALGGGNKKDGKGDGEGEGEEGTGKGFAYEGSEDTRAVCARCEDFFPAVEGMLRAMMERVEARKGNGEEEGKEEKKMRVFLGEFVKRFVYGYDIDQRLMFEYAMWPGGSRYEKGVVVDKGPSL